MRVSHQILAAGDCVFSPLTRRKSCIFSKKRPGPVNPRLIGSSPTCRAKKLSLEPEAAGCKHLPDADLNLVYWGVVKWVTDSAGQIRGMRSRICQDRWVSDLARCADGLGGGVGFCDWGLAVPNLQVRALYHRL